MDTELKIEQVLLADIKPYKNNAKKHPAEQVANVAESIKTMGWRQPIVLDGTGVIIIGHGRYLAAKQLNLETVPCHYAKDLTAEQVRKLRILDNKLNESEWDYELLKIDSKGLDFKEYNLEWGGIFEEEKHTVVVEDEVPEVNDNFPPTTQLGDIWKLGEHRLMCGDSTDKETVEKLMDGAKADMVFTDPPYNVDYSGRGEVNKLGNIKNDSMTDEEFNEFCDKFFACYDMALKEGGVIYVCHPDSQSAPKIAFEVNFANYFRKSSTLIWVKQSAGMGWQDYRAQHEPILYGWKEGKEGHYNAGDRTETTVWEISRDSVSKYVHPTQKPVELPARAIRNSSKQSDVVMDLFGGSGSTLIACEQLNRRCRTMELDPKYCDVIIKRWETLTGKKAELIKGE